MFFRDPMATLGPMVQKVDPALMDERETLDSKDGKVQQELKYVV